MPKHKTIQWPLWLWGLIPIVAVIEIFAEWQIPRKEPSTDEWQKVAQAIAEEKQNHDLVIITPSWATQGRMFLSSLIPLKDFGRFDNTLYERVFEISIDGSRAEETSNLVIENKFEFGRIKVYQYKLPPRSEVVYDFLDNASSSAATRANKLLPQILIDHWFTPRLVIPVPLGPDPITLSFENIPLNGVIYGYGIIGYRDARYDEGGPVSLSVYVDDTKLGETLIHNFGSLHPFNFSLPNKEKGNVQFKIKANDGFKREFGFVADIRREPGSEI